MIITAIFFYLFAAACIASAILVVTARNPVHSVLFLIIAFVNASGLFILLGAEFLAMILIVVYVGAVAVLFLFVVMMLDIDLVALREGFTRFAWLGWLTALAIIVEIAGVVWSRGGLGIDASHGGEPTSATYSNTLELGRVLYTKYAYPLELAAMVLLVAIIAAISLTLRRRSEYKQQNISAQVAVRARDRLRLVKMDPEKRL